MPLATAKSIADQDRETSSITNGDFILSEQ